MTLDPPREASAPLDDSNRGNAELATLYEMARGLLGARSARQVAWRTVYSALGTLGVRSGAMFVADPRGRFRNLATAGLENAPASEALSIATETRDWILEHAAFPLAGPAAARGLGALRDTLIRDFEAEVAVAVPGANGLDALLVFGAPLLPDSGDLDLQLLTSLATLAGQALAGCDAAADGDARNTAKRTARPHEPVTAARRPERAARQLGQLRERFQALDALVGESAALLDACRDLVAVAPTRFPVLLTGESGVGKELAAHAVHAMSDRSSGPFEVVDCGSIPTELIESELFGHVRGAFTGAQRDRRGAFELAHRGTLFLDEIGDMPLQLQTRLLRVLQESRFRRVGDERMLDVDVRVVAATNRDLAAEVAGKRFRQDLYYRLNVFAVHMPSLRERTEDIGVLLGHFLEMQGRELGARGWDVDPEVVRALESYAWPGNIRELVNLCAALVVHARDSRRVSLADLAHVWKRQYVGRGAPWSEGGLPARGQLGEWVIDQARAAKFNLVELARLLQRQKRAGHGVPLAERSALSYYLTGEILRALAEHRGDVAAAAAALGRDEDLSRRVMGRVQKVADAIGAAKDEEALRVRFAKLPAGYEEALSAAWNAVTA
jgi:transcriptional regulator with GAF, ATPase, and Fis domain